MTDYELVAGLEVHVELKTASKIFCSCTTDFGGDPNTHVCPICSGLPGTLPVLNEKVVEFGVKTGLALHCELTQLNKFDRKNYFYPDLPKAYQVSQLFFPICTNGQLRIATSEGEKDIRIHEIHMEEDAGKLVHEADCTLSDNNRGGVALLEIVSEPDFRSAEEVVAYLEKLRDILTYLGVSDCKMQEGRMRADINISVRPRGQEKLGVRAEMKNMNSLKAIQRAIKYEYKRQVKAIEKGETLTQQTRRWDEETGESYAMRSKENAQDYRYFPDPDLAPVELGQQMQERIRALLPELPEQKRQRYQEQFGLSPYDAELLTSAQQWAQLFEDTVAQQACAKEVANLIMGDLMRLSGEAGTLPEELDIDPKKLAQLIGLVTQGKINRTVGKQVVEQIFAHNIDPEQYVKDQGLLMLDDPDLLVLTVEQVLGENPKAVEEYLSGKDKAFASLVGQTMKKLKGKADPKAVNELLREKLKK